MKTRILKVFVAMAIAATLATGCATRQHATIKNGDQEIYNSNHVGIFPGPDNAISAATAEAIIITARAEAEMIKNYSQGNGVGETTAKYCVVATNLTNKIAYIYHPELGRDFELAPNNGHKFLFLSSLPGRMIFKNYQGRIVWEPQPDMEKLKHKKVFLGREVDLRFNLTYQ